MTRSVSAMLALLGLVACTEKDKPQPIAPVVELAKPAATPVAVASAAPAPVVETLPADEKDPRSCNYDVPEQSCIPGSEADMWGCATECADKCTSCAKDCGPKGRPCLDGCVKGRDDCRTECTKLVAAAEKERGDNYGCREKKKRSVDICKIAVACREKCPADSDACRNACGKSKAPGCNAHFMYFVESDNCFPLDDGP